MASAPVDIPIKVKGLSELEKVSARMEALEKEVTRLQKAGPKAANAIKPIGPAAKGAAVGVRGLGAAFKAALGPISLALSAIGGLGTAFNALKQQDFAEAKVKSLGVNADELVGRLTQVSRELQGSASVAQLTGAAYDVASAGFTNAADAAMVLKAASLGATGGFSDINTTANATTSVLNAYGLSASNAGKLVDQFIQTQNDGKIVVAEYAQNIGKVASAAAGLGVPLSEVNAVIAQATASGVNAEVAFTGLKGALAGLASGDATKRMSDLGINIDAGTIASEGLLGTFKRIKDSGADVGQVFKLLGAEAGPALLPVLNNLEKYEQLVKNQEQAAGVAAQAQLTASATIEGAWKRLTNAFQNLFADQSELGQLIRGVLLAAAATVELLAAAFKLAIAPVRALIVGVQAVGKAMGFTSDAEDGLQAFTKVWFDLLQAVDDVSAFIIGAGVRIGDAIGSMVAWVANEFEWLWGTITGGVQQVPGAITSAFADGFNAVSQMVADFFNGLPGWLQSALKTVGGAAGSIAGAVMNMGAKALDFAGGKIKEAAGFLKEQIGITIDVGKGFTSGSLSGIPAAATQTAGGSGGGGGGGGSGGGGGGGGGGGAADKAAQEAKRAQEVMERQLKTAQDLVFASENQLRISKEMSELERISAEAAVKKLEIEKEYGELLEASKSAAETALLQVAQTNELKANELDKEQALKDLREGAVASIDEEIAALTAKIAGKEKEYEIAKKIKELEESGVTNAEGKVNKLYALREQATAADELKASYESLAGSISGALTESLRGLVDGSMTAKEAMANAFQGMADAFLDMAMQMIQEFLKMQMMGLIQSFFGGGLSSGGLGSFGGGSPLGSLSGSMGWSSFAGGGYTGNGARSGGLDGKGGFMAMVHPNETVVDHSRGNAGMNEAMRRYSMTNGGGSMSGSGSFHLDTTVINNVEYATVEQVKAMGRQSTRDGAAAGKAQTMNSMRNSRGQRSRLGMS